jgi:hypothetical protein
LTDDQQSQIKDATGRDIKEISLDLSVVDQLADQDLAKASGGIHHEGM